jgi:holin-like protein
VFAAIVTVLICQLAGELAAGWLGLPVPGPVLGMLVFLAWLAARRGPSAPELALSGFLLAHLGLLFVPAGVGIVEHAQALGDQAWRLAGVMAASTLVTMAVTALVMKLCMASTGGGEANER